MGWYATVSMNATSAVWRVSHSNGLSICCHQYRCSIHWYYPEVAFFLLLPHQPDFILFYIMSSLILLHAHHVQSDFTFFLSIMSSLIPFSDHHVQLDFIFCPSCPAWFYFCTSCPAWFYFLFIMSSLVICFVPSHNAFTRCTDNTGNHPLSATIQPF